MFDPVSHVGVRRGQSSLLEHGFQLQAHMRSGRGRNDHIWKADEIRDGSWGQRGSSLSHVLKPSGLVLMVADPAINSGQMGKINGEIEKKRKEEKKNYRISYISTYNEEKK